MMFDRGPVYFLSDVFAIVADVIAKAPLTTVSYTHLTLPTIYSV